MAASVVRKRRNFTVPRASKDGDKGGTTLEERRERRRLRREKQRKDNIGRATMMHAARLKKETAVTGGRPAPLGVDCDSGDLRRKQGALRMSVSR